MGGSGSAEHVSGLAVPTLCIQAENDPIARIAATPFEVLERNEQCVTMVTKMGGHLGWFDSMESLRGAPWVHEIALDFFDTLQETHAVRPSRSSSVPAPAEAAAASPGE